MQLGKRTEVYDYKVADEMIDRQATAASGQRGYELPGYELRG